MPYASNATAEELGAELRAASRVLLLSHAKPDGDALGSLLALRECVLGHGAVGEAVLMGPVEGALLEIGKAIMERGVRASGGLRVLEREGLPAAEPDLIVLVDTGSWAQVEPVAAWLRPRRERMIGVDHHAGGSEDLVPRRLVEPACASTTQALVPVLEAAGAQMTPALASALYMGLATDTGWFRFASADARVFALASRLLAAGAHRDLIYARLEQNAKLPRLALLARALASLELHGAGTASIMSLGLEDFAATGAGPEDAGGFVNEAMALRSVRLSILLTQVEPGVTKASFRSKPLLPGDARESLVDVNALAARFGGGGHVHAAGARLNADLAKARGLVADAVNQ
jgi:phosphoesterase RecJ-like protein